MENYESIYKKKKKPYKRMNPLMKKRADTNTDAMYRSVFEVQLAQRETRCTRTKKIKDLKRKVNNRRNR